MNKLQFWALNLTSLALAALLSTHLFLVSRNSRLAQSLARDRGSLARDQDYINSAQQLAPVLDRLARRIAIGSDTDPRLKNILVKYGLHVTVEVDGQKKNYP